MDKKDYIAQVMDEWYLAMAANNVTVQPKASTLLGMLLANYDIKPKYESRDIWDEFQTVSGGNFLGWYASLTQDQREQWHKEAKQAQRPKPNKSLLKG